MLDSADGIVMLLRYRAWPDADMKHFVDAYHRGVPIIGLRTSTHAFRYPANSQSLYKDYTNFGKKVLGEGWVNHWGPNRKGATRGILPQDGKTRPLLNGVTDILCDSGVYEVYPPSDADILVHGQVLKGMKATDPPADYKKKRSTDKVEQGVNDPMMAAAWTRIHKNDAGKQNRVFCTTMGAATDLQSEGLRRLVVNAVYWGFELNVPAMADVAVIGEFKPTAYGTKIYKKGLKPADLALTAVSVPQEKKSDVPPPPAKKVEHTMDSLDTIKSRLADKKAVLFDVRELPEWNGGHLKDAKLLPLSKINEKDSSAELAKVLPKDQIIYLHCASGKPACWRQPSCRNSVTTPGRSRKVITLWSKPGFRRRINNTDV